MATKPKNVFFFAFFSALGLASQNTKIQHAVGAWVRDYVVVIYNKEIKYHCGP